jgi:hypothetical protein
MEKFYEKHDVISDLRPYLTLLDAKGDTETLQKRIAARCEEVDEQEEQVQQMHAKKRAEKDEICDWEPPVTMKSIRYKMMYHKLSRAMGLYSREKITEREDAYDLVNEIFKVFLQAMEHHKENINMQIKQKM